jgi:hypothetical protein
MAFAKHETFYIREGWLFKGMAAIKNAEETGKSSTIFMDDHAPELLGIGQNMVRALRFWMQAVGLAEEKMERQRVQKLTDFGEAIWMYDRFLENDATLWFLHYRLASNEQHATTWYWFFNHFTPSTFDERTCLDALSNWVISQYPDLQIAPGSLKRDFDCFLQTYLTSKTSHTPEELTESPFARLCLLTRVDDTTQKRYRLERLDSARIHPLVLLYVLVDRQRQARNGIFQVGLSEILREPMNAGRVFNLTTAGLSDLLAELNKDYPDLRVRFVRTAGLDQLTLPECEPLKILKHYYTERVARHRNV